MLGVGIDVDEVGLKQAFRIWVRVNHPDKIGGGGVHNKEELFKAVREGYEALKDPVVRFAYDRSVSCFQLYFTFCLFKRPGLRFGSDVLTWTSCTTQREYMRHGLMQSSGYHIVTFAGLVGFGAVGKPTSVSFVRFHWITTLVLTNKTHSGGTYSTHSISQPSYPSS